MLHRVAQATNAVVQQANRYIDTQAPWALRKSDPARMQTVLWVLMETLRHVGIVQQPITPTIASALLDQITVPKDAASRNFAALTPAHAIEGGKPLPEPSIIVPRYERPEEEVAAEAAAAAAKKAAAEAAAAAAAAASELSSDELSDLEGAIGVAGDAVRNAKVALKEGGGSQEDMDAALASLLELKGRLPAGHPLLGGGKKKKKK